MTKITFHRNGTVSANGKPVGTYSPPDPSGAAHARSPRWVFCSEYLRDKVALARTRGDLVDRIKIAALARDRQEA